MNIFSKYESPLKYNTCISFSEFPYTSIDLKFPLSIQQIVYNLYTLKNNT
jgi:hypothetical protein